VPQALTAPHAAEAAEVVAALGSARTGLAAAEAERRLRRDGPNRLPERRRRGPLRRFLAQFANLLIGVLLAAAAVTAATGHPIDTAVILTVVLVTALLGFIQEGRAERSVEAIRGLLAPRAAVLRDGARQDIDAAGVVTGDVVLLEAGERVPADLRLIAAHGLLIDEAVLTGESVPAAKHTRPVAAAAAVADRASMAHSGTIVAAGSGSGVVTATGAATEIGRISGLAAEVEPLATPLVRQMDRFSRWLTVVILLVAGLVLLYGLTVRGLPFAEMMMNALGLAVAAIPEGLPAVLTVALAVGVRAMARQNAIVRRLPSIETIGAVSVICTDKTGTLTRNEMAVASVEVEGESFTLDGAGYGPGGGIRRKGLPAGPAADPVLTRLARAAAACNDAALRAGPQGWTVEGDPMEGALLAMAGRILGGPFPPARPERLAAIPFDARHRFMAVLAPADGPGGGRIVAVKGAPERVLAMCRAVATAGGDAPLDPARWHAAADRIAASGQRVLALAELRLPGDAGRLDADAIDGRLVLLGLAILIDPPRPEAVAAVADCRRAGIRVKMITGDHAGTARAIAAQIGLESPAGVLTGAEIDGMDDARLAAAALATDVFARTSPEHKLRLVTALQSHGLVVAMTGDGVNDAPALRRADIGIAMGRKGSEAAREAAQIILADDNFATIAAAVREGRTVHDNIRKIVAWTLPTNAGEALTLVVALLAGLPLPATALQVLWVNLVTEITLGIALAFEPTEAGTMRRPPRRRDAPILSGALAWHILFVSALFLAAVFGIYHHAIAQGHSADLARTMAVNMLVVLEVFHLFYVRNIYGTSLTLGAVAGTPAVWITVAAVTALQLGFTYLPLSHAVFGTVPVPLRDGAVILAAGAVFLAVLEAEKQVRLVLTSPSPPPASP